MTPEERAAELIGRHLRRERLQEHWQDDIAQAIDAAVAEAKEECAAYVEEQGRLLKSMFEDDRGQALLRDLAAGIRAKA